MIRFIKSLPFQFRFACKSLYRHRTMTVSASSAVSVTLVLMSLFMLLTVNLNSFTKNIEVDFKIHATIDDVFIDSEIKELEQQLKKVEGVSKVTFSSKDEELEAFIQEKGKIFEFHRGEGNPMRNAFIIEVSQPERIPQIKSELEALEGIEKAQYGGDTIAMMIQTFEYIRIGGGLFVIILSLLAIFLISNTIKMTIYARHTEIGIMRNVGATNLFIKMPFIIEGMFIGILGSIIPIALTYFGYATLYQYMDGVFLSQMFILQPIQPMIPILCLLLVVCGVIVGMVGSALAVSKYLRWKR
ncbi:MAG: permease-like cell division protein FtsX [Erysipelotrichaceae bacterium]|nr:permease-like cell division protein FtsX [Erysipelotrichaceae bacterium]